MNSMSGQGQKSRTTLGRRDFLEALGIVGAATLLGGCETTPGGKGGMHSDKPNVILIVADDMGYGELGIQGSKDIPTPNIDSIAHNGVRFTNGYVSCPICSPTRAGLMTGRYQQRFGHELNPGPADEANPEFGLPLSETTIPERLKSLGYATGMFGKWHLGFRPELQPTKRGFDEFYGFLAGAHPYLRAAGGPQNAIMRGTEPVADMDYTTDAFTREAVSFIDRHKKDPFFLYLPYNAVHAPLESLQKYLSRFEGITDKKRRTFAAMLSALDDGVGQVLGKVRALGLEKDTLIFFISDNGGPTSQTTSGNAPLRGFKAQVLEGGIRIPFLMQWKGRLPEGKVVDTPVISLDIHPTILAAVGAPAPQDKPLDGVDLLPHLNGKKNAPPHGRLFWRFGEQSAIRMGDWKMLKMAKGDSQLYNLAEDIAEGNDLAVQNPEKLKELQTAYDAWNATLVPPRWKRGAQGQQRQDGSQKVRPRRKPKNAG